MVKIPLQPPEGLIIKLAETEEEFDQAFTLIQECYREIGISEENLKLRATKYHSLPTSQIVIAKMKDNVIATLTHVFDSPLGLPIEEHWSVEHERKNGKLLAEISSLAIHKSWRHFHGLFLYLTRFALDLAIHHLGVDKWVIVTHPKAKDFYEGLLCFEPLSENILKCGYVKGADGFAQTLDLVQLKANFEKLYANKAKDKNIHDFYFVTDFKQIMKPIKKQLTLHNQMSASYFLRLFGEVTNLLDNLDKFDKLTLKGMYSDFIPELSSLTQQRVETRTPTSIKAFIKEDNINYLVRILNVSAGGVKIFCKGDFSPNRQHILSIQISPAKKVDVPVKLVWSKDNIYQGFSILGEPSTQWLSWTHQLKSEFSQSLNTKIS